MTVHQNLTSQNARESTIDIFRRVVVLSKMPIFPWLGQPPRPQPFSAKDPVAMRKSNGPAQQAVGKRSTFRESTKASGESTHRERRPSPTLESTEIRRRTAQAKKTRLATMLAYAKHGSIMVIKRTMDAEEARAYVLGAGCR